MLVAFARGLGLFYSSKPLPGITLVDRNKDQLEHCWP
jgi:hypothetical protein